MFNQFGLLKRRAFARTLSLVLFSSFNVAWSHRPATTEPGNGWSLAVGQFGVTQGTCVSSAAFRLDGAESLHPLVQPGGETAVFETYLEVWDNGRYRFGLECAGGEAELIVATIDGAELQRFENSVGGLVLGPYADLKSGRLHLQVRFTRAAEGAAFLRSYWEREIEPRGGFRLEPIPTRRCTPPPDSKPQIERALAERAGRVLLEQKGCTNCHFSGLSDGVIVGRREAPKIWGLSGRLRSGWVLDWLQNSAEIKSGADMPHLFGANEEPGELEDLAQFLMATHGDGEPEADSGPASEESVLRRGLELYHDVGCAACHGALASPAELFENEFAESQLPDAKVIAPLGELAGKWKPAALSAFLRDPLSVYADGVMPDMRLTEEESDAIANYLLRATGGERLPDMDLDMERIDAGVAVFKKRRCGDCHAIPGLEPEDFCGNPLATLNPTKGCLDPDDVGSPRYDFSQAELDQMRLALQTVRKAQGVAVPLDQGERCFERLACAACHQRDGVGGPDDGLRYVFNSVGEEVDLGDEGRFAPDLTAAGYKLTSQWLRAILTDGGVSRPYLATRMPQYGAQNLGSLVTSLASREGLAPDSDREAPIVTDSDVQIGRELMGRQALGCIACHVYRDYPPAGTPGPAFEQFAERLRYEWFANYLWDPQRYLPGSRMPSFGRGNQSTLKSVLGGELDRQIDAIWAYFSLGEFMPAPEGLEPSQASLMLSVEDRPLVMRCFLEGAGSRGIAVGFPSGLHIGFDASRARLVDAWKGSFLDASSSWAGRGGQIAGGLGAVTWTAPPGHVLLLEAPSLEEPESDPQQGERTSESSEPQQLQWNFRGYRLDDRGYPTFLYSHGEIEVEERITTQLLPKAKILRDFLVRGAEGKLWVREMDANSAIRKVMGANIENTEISGISALTPHADNPIGIISFRMEVSL